jgi:hypothetical protein
MSKRMITIGAVTIVMLVVGSVWAFRSRSDPQVEKIKQMLNENTPPEQQPQRWELVRKEMDQLSPEQRGEVRQEMRKSFERRMDQQIATYFALPATERVAFLDKQIDETEKRRKEWEARRSSQAGSQRSGSGQPGNAAGQGPPRNMSSDARMQRRDQRLDQSTAQQRATRSAYFAEMRARRIQRGLPPSPFPGGGPR